VKTNNSGLIALIFLIIIVIIPVAATASGAWGNIDYVEKIDGVNASITGLTLVDDSIDPNYHYIPKYTHAHYNSDGNISILKYFTSDYIYVNSTELISFPDDSIPKDIEVPSGSIISRDFIHLPNGMIEKRDFFGHSDDTSSLRTHLENYYLNDSRYIVTCNNETILIVTWDEGAFPQPQREHTVGSVAPYKSLTWVEWAEANPTLQTEYRRFDAAWKVPKDPTFKAPLGKTYIFNGITTIEGKIKKGFSEGIIQPVLMWNCGEINPKTHACKGGTTDYVWSGMAVTSCLNGTDFIGEKIPVKPGDDIIGKMTWDSKESSWDIDFTDLTTMAVSNMSSKNIVPNDSDYVTPVLTLENYASHNICKDGRFKELWPQSEIKFEDIRVWSTLGEITYRIPFAGFHDKRRFVEDSYCRQCETQENYPQYDRDHYFVFIPRFGSKPSVTLQTHPLPKDLMSRFNTSRIAQT
jgi:hypothetical protein